MTIHHFFNQTWYAVDQPISIYVGHRAAPKIKIGVSYVPHDTNSSKQVHGYLTVEEAQHLAMHLLDVIQQHQSTTTEGG